MYVCTLRLLSTGIQVPFSMSELRIVENTLGRILSSDGFLASSPVTALISALVSSLAAFPFGLPHCQNDWWAM